MLLFSLFLIFSCDVCVSEKSDLGYGLNIGNAIDVFANYGDLSQVTQVVSADYEDEKQEPTVPFSEKNIRVFTNATSSEDNNEASSQMDILLCETFENLLDTYFSNFKIEGTDKPWKAFMGDWIFDEMLRTLGIIYDGKGDNCCYVLIKLTKIHKSVKLDDLSQVTIKDYVETAIDELDFRDPIKVRKFMKSYGTHYIDSYVTGNFIYQVFKYKRNWFNILKAKIRNARHTGSSNLRIYFSSIFLTQVGDIKIASGNKTVEDWARRNLRDSQYLYSRPSLLRLQYSPKLTSKLNQFLDNGALLGLSLKTLRPLFRDRRKGNLYAELVENDLQLWEVNA
ncbi:torso-like protein [Achroia grisella]|uniref:torso-like protein n=1 Tax=Achroia grisella TaxID=688607 RepID=UPI0027D307A5|nr:torso-like protein [Achroia grisella]